MFTKRLIAFALAAVALTATACGGGSDETADDMSISIGSFPGTTALPILIADKYGLFEDNGLDVELIDAQNGTELMSGLIGGTTQVSIGAPGSVVPALQQGQDIVMLPPFGQMFYNLVATKDSGVTELKDLVGKTVAIPARGDAPEQFVRELLIQEGIDPDSVNFVAAGAPFQHLPLLQRGDAVAGVYAHPLVASFEANGLPMQMIATRLDGSEGEVGEYGLAAFLITTQSFIDENPKTTEALCTTFESVVDWMQDPANAADGAAILEEITGLPPADAERVWPLEIEYWIKSIDAERWDKNVDLVLRNTENAPEAEAPFSVGCQ